MNNYDNYDNYFKIEKIGIGGGGNPVYIVKNLTNGKKLALKKIIINKDCPEEMQCCINEIQIFKQLDHPYLIKYEDSFLHKNKIYIVMEYANEKDLETKIKNYKLKKEKISENLIWKYFLQIISGISYLHSNKILHRDIKGQNILLSNDNVKIGDFGTSKKMDNTNAFANTSLGTPFFLSPEICRGEPYNFKSDNWMIGCVLFELMTLELPFTGNNLPIIMNNIIYNPIPDISNLNYSDELKFLCINLLKKNMDERISLNDIINRPFVKEKIKSLKIYFHNNNNNNNVNNLYNNICNSNCLCRNDIIEDKCIKNKNCFNPIYLIKQSQFNQNVKKNLTQISTSSNSDSYTGPQSPNMSSPSESENEKKKSIHNNSNYSLTKNTHLIKNNINQYNHRGMSPGQLNVNVNCNYSISPMKRRTKVYQYEICCDENNICNMHDNNSK